MDINIFFLELIAVIAGVVSVWLAKRESVLLYPIGILSVVLWVFLCYRSQLYGQAIVNLFFFLMNVYGWYNWSRKKEDSSNFVVIKSNSRFENVISIFSVFIITPILFYFLFPLKDDNTHLFFVFIDVLTTAMFFVAMWLMAWKRLENWVIWIIADVLCVPLFIYNEFYLSVIQFSLFIVIAFIGYYDWKKKCN